MRRRDCLLTPIVALAGWSLATLPVRAATDRQEGGSKLVVILLRGAVDGLSVLAPYGERAYYEARDTIALAAPGSAEGALLRLDPLFGLHPALGRLLPFWTQHHLAFVHASGSPDPTRSHFDAQDYMESGTPGRKSTPDGWMNRILAGLPGPLTPTRAINLGATPPRIFSGPSTVTSLGLGPRALDARPVDDPRLRSALDQLYAQDAAFARMARDSASAREAMRERLSAADQSGEGRPIAGADPSADAGAPPARGFAADALRLGRLLHADPRSQLAFTSLGGWDTHINQGAHRGILANSLVGLGEGLEALARGLGASFDRTIVLVMSEFGRTVRQNGNGGTDHGRGNVMWLLGGPVRGGRVFGDWPGLAASSLVDGRDLAVTTDFRAVLRAVLERHLRLDDRSLERVFPGFQGDALAGLC